MKLQRITDGLNNGQQVMASEYFAATGDSSPHLLVEATNQDKGLLLITEKFKAMAFKNKTICKQLLEALEHYSNNPTESYPLYIELTGGYNFSVSMDTSKEVEGTWKKQADKTAYYFSSDDESWSPATANIQNPFIVKVGSPSVQARAHKEKPSK